MLSKISTLCLYIAVFSLSAILMHQSDKKYANINVKRMYIVISFLMPVLLSGFRACGTDIYTYASQYGRALKEPIKWFWQENGSFEIAYALIAKTARRLNNIRILFTTCAVITVLPVYKSIWEHKKVQIIGIALLAYLMNFFPTSWNIIRQYMAVGIVCYSYRYIFERDLKKYLVCIFLAFSCHTSSIIMLPIYFLWTKENKLVNNWKIWGLIVILIIVSTQLESILGGNLSGDLERFEGYLDGHGSGKNRDFFINVIVMIIMLCFYKPLKKLDERNTLYIVMLVFQTIIGLTGFNSPYIKRVGIYFGITQIFLFGSLPLITNDKRWRMVIIMTEILYIIGLFWLVDYFLNQPMIVPYKWIFPKGLF